VELELLVTSVITGLLLGCFYAAIAQGLQISFGLLEVPQLAHPAMLVLGGYASLGLARLSIDPLLAGLLLSPAFYVLGIVLYRFYHATFEASGPDQELRGFAFFFGLAYLIEVGLVLSFGVDQQLAQAPYICASISILEMRIPIRMLVASAVAVSLTAGLMIYISTSFMGRAIRAVAQQPEGLVIVGADPVRIRQVAFGLATATASICGSMLLLVGPIEPNLGWTYLGRVFVIVVLAGMGSLGGTLAAAIILAITESVVLSSVGSSWTPAVSFGMLLLVLAFKPSGLFGRR
jgi:branched-chain amino acid transport system permease protein